MWETFVNWFLNLGANYGVNPLIFGAIYIGAIPFFLLSISWLIRNYRAGKSIILPAFSACLFFLSSYIYLIFVGKNVPIWIYAAVFLLITFGIYSTVKKVRRQVREADAEK